MTVLETDPGPPAPTTHGRARPGRGRLVVIAAVALGVLGMAVSGWWVASRSWTGASTPAELTALGAPRFVEVSAAAGVDQVYDGDFSFYVGGGVAAFDCDDDRRLDLYVAGGERPAALYRNVSTVGSLAFTAEPSEATDLPAVTGAYPIDIDGDRLTDLVVLRVGGNVILRGLGDCRFERANEALAIDGGDAWTVGFSATWETAGARLPTLAFGNYVVPEPASEGIGDCDRNWLVRPDTDASRVTYGAPVALDPGACALSMLFSDWDRSGRRDLRISNDRHYDPNAEEQLWRIAPDEAPRRYSRDEGWERLQIFGMGIASEDLTGDGYPEVYLTSQGDNKLQTLADGPARPTYRDIALARSATAHRPFTGDDVRPSTAWHPAFADANNDALTDLYIGKGNVEAQTDHAMADPSDLLLGQVDGSFVQGAVEAGIVDMASVRGAAIVDLDGDGLLDLIQVARRDHVRVWHNLGAASAPATGERQQAVAMGHWLGIVLDQDAPNHDAIGAWVAVRIGDRTMERERTIGGGHASGALGPVHVGLGAATAAQVRVTWPDGEVGPWLDVEGDQVVVVRRGATAVEPWTR